MNIDYSQFLKMIPEVTLMTILVIAFIADFCSSKASERKWFNPLMCVLMLVHILINLNPVATSTTFGGMYATNASIGVIKSILAVGTLIVMIQAKEWLSRNFKAITVFLNCSGYSRQPLKKYCMKKAKDVYIVSYQ